MSKKIYLKDELPLKADRIGSQRGFWVKTEILGGYGIHKNPVTGISELDETIFTSKNTVCIGGVQYAMEQIFGISGPITVPTLYSQMGIGAADKNYTGREIDVPDGTGKHTMPYAYGNRICLFGIGLSGYGGGENAITKYPVDYRENAIQNVKSGSDGTSLNGLMIPFRYTTQDLSSTDQTKYFGIKTDSSTGYTSYFLKRFETEPNIYHYWNTSGTVDGSEDDASEVTQAEVWDSTRTTAVLSLTEITLKVSNKDVKEYFEITGSLGDPRFNTVALYDAIYDADESDYRNVRMFSKLYIPNENLSLSKDLDLIYRVYGA